MSTGHAELRNEIIASLQELSHATEIVYMSMADSYPSLIHEMKTSLKKSEKLLHGNTGEQIRNFGDTPLLQIISDTRDFIAKANEGFSQAHEKDRGMHHGLGEQLASINSLGEFIKHIRNDSSAMELISLNAMTVAFKAGSQGRAFSFITEELKRLSGQTIELTNQVTSRGESLVKLFTSFQEELIRLNDQEEAIFGAFMNRMDQIFEDFTNGVKTIINEILDLRKQSEQVQVPLVTIMTEIQNHDLIRQSIDHVIISLNEIRNINHVEGDDLEHTLDELSFLEILPNLCINVLNEIASQISQNKQVFQTNLTEAKELINHLEQERAHFIAHSLDTSKPDSLDSKFNNSRRMFETLSHDIEALYRNKEGTVSHSKYLQSQVKDLDESFKSFESLITRFRTIDVSSRIEIAKQSVLYQMKGTVDEMTALTMQIDRDVEGSTNVTSAFLEGTQRILDEYRKAFGQQSRISRQFMDRLSQKTKRLNFAKDALIKSIQDSEIFTHTFLEQFTMTGQDLEKLSKLLGQIEVQKSSLSQIRERLVAEKTAFMAPRGIKEWKLENRKLRAMIDRFTIFTHKKFAGDLGGFQIEEGVQSGEITFF